MFLFFISSLIIDIHLEIFHFQYMSSPQFSFKNIYQMRVHHYFSTYIHGFCEKKNLEVDVKKKITVMSNKK